MSATEPDELVRLADDALYRAKARTRPRGRVRRESGARRAAERFETRFGAVAEFRDGCTRCRPCEPSEAPLACLKAMARRTFAEEVNRARLREPCKDTKARRALSWPAAGRGVQSPARLQLEPHVSTTKRRGACRTASIT